MNKQQTKRLPKRITVPAGAIGVLWVYPEHINSRTGSVPIPATDDDGTLTVDFITPGGAHRLSIDFAPNHSDEGTQANVMVYDGGRQLISLSIDGADRVQQEGGAQ